MEKPKFYREEDERLVEMQTRVDLRMLASLHQFLAEEKGIVIHNRSDLLRTIVEMMYTALDNEGQLVQYSLHSDAHNYLKRFNLGLKRGSRARRKFDKFVQSSESFDIEHMGGTQSQKEQYEELLGLEMGMKTAGYTVDQIERRLRYICKQRGIDYDLFRDQHTGTDWRENVKENPHGDRIVDPSARSAQSTQSQSDTHKKKPLNPNTSNKPSEQNVLTEQQLRMRREREDKEQLDAMKNTLGKPNVDTVE